VSDRRILEATGEPTDFHDSALLSFSYDAAKDQALVLLEVDSWKKSKERWLVELRSVLHIGLDVNSLPGPEGRYDAPEIYDVFLLRSSSQYRRWEARLEELGQATTGEADHLFHVVFASSVLCNWEVGAEGPRGLEIVCRHLSLRQIDVSDNLAQTLNEIVT
jgi:hypothetical protein